MITSQYRPFGWCEGPSPELQRITYAMYRKATSPYIFNWYIAAKVKAIQAIATAIFDAALYIVNAPVRPLICLASLEFSRAGRHFVQSLGDAVRSVKMIALLTISVVISIIYPKIMINFSYKPRVPAASQLTQLQDNLDFANQTIQQHLGEIENLRSQITTISEEKDQARAELNQLRKQRDQLDAEKGVMANTLTETARALEEAKSSGLEAKEASRVRLELLSKQRSKVLPFIQKKIAKLTADFNKMPPKKREEKQKELDRRVRQLQLLEQLLREIIYADSSPSLEQAYGSCKKLIENKAENGKDDTATPARRKRSHSVDSPFRTPAQLTTILEATPSRESSFDGFDQSHNETQQGIE